MRGRRGHALAVLELGSIEPEGVHFVVDVDQSRLRIHLDERGREAALLRESHVKACVSTRAELACAVDLVVVGAVAVVYVISRYKA